MGYDIPFAKKGVFEGIRHSYKIFIPGSSFKGSLRSATSRIASLYGFKSCGEVGPEAIEKAHSSGGICDVCKLFGYPKNNVPSKIMVSDFEPIDHPHTMGLTKLRIDNSSLKAAEGALFTSEYVIPKTTFKGSISIREVETKLLGLLLLGLAELRMGRFGRASIIDLMLEDTNFLEKELKGTNWLSLLTDLKEWLWE
ncbi:MAG: RAMP superfamily CRISPR-associated protein [Thermoproteota archaeon]